VPDPNANSGPATTIVTAVLAAVLGGTGGALLTYIFGKKKTQAEIENLRAEAQKNRAEADKISAELKGVVSYSLAASDEQILFDGSARIDGFDVRGNEGNFWKSTTPKGLGELKFEEGGILNIQRKNKDGRFELWFQRYDYKGTERQTIPKDDLISGKRKLRVSCEAKVSGVEHSLRFILRQPSGDRLAEQRFTVKSSEWTKFQVFLSADPLDCILRIDDEIDARVSLPPGSVQIRNIVLAQRR
jgi:hypothetical protein